MSMQDRAESVNYRLHYKLSGHSGSILSLAAREDGKLLASGGSDGTKVWDLGGHLVCWRQEDSRAAFREVWCFQLKGAAEISSVAFDATTNRLAVSNRQGVVQMYTLNAAMAKTEIFSHSIEKCIPRAVAFGALHGNERELLVFGLYCGRIYIIRGNSPPTAANAWNVGARIGDVALDAAKGVLCMDDPSTGVNLYRLADRELIKSFSVPVKKFQRIRQVRLLNGCTSIVSGSDHGTVYVYDRRSGSLVAELRLHPNEWTATIDGIPTIFAAQTRDITGANDIFVWGQRTNKRRLIGRVIAVFVLLVKVMILLAALAFAFEKAFGGWKSTSELGAVSQNGALEGSIPTIDA
ncbi:WD40-repeat-containing domain protein [Mycena amicta]|nr:WD40-repeat-containing domain protein [Mycena amicta]